MAEPVTTPRLVYKGTPAANEAGKGTQDDPVQTKRVEDQDALAAAQKDGWRLTYKPDGKQPDKPAPRGKAGVESASEPGHPPTAEPPR